MINSHVLYRTELRGLNHETEKRYLKICFTNLISRFLPSFNFKALGIKEDISILINIWEVFEGLFYK